jgi:hypothetical protein
VGGISLASRYAPGLAPADSSRSAEGVITLDGNGAPLMLQYWPRGVAGEARVAGDRWRSAGVLGERWRVDDVAMIVVRAGRPPGGADPGVARAWARPR